MVKKAMLSQPMAGKTDDEIREAREKAITALEKEGCEIVNTLFTDEWYSKESMEERGVVQIPLCFLARALRVCRNAMSHIFVRDGKMPEDVESNMMRQSLMALKSSMKYRRR